MSLKDGIMKIGDKALQVGIRAGKSIAQDFTKSVGYDLFGDDNEENEDFRVPEVKNKKKATKYGIAKNKMLSRAVYFPYADWRHKLIIGATGAGKNTMAENVVKNCKTGCCFIDNAKGSSVDNLIRCFSDERLRKTIVLDHSVREKPLAVGNVKGADNVFENDKIVAHYEDFFITNFNIGDMFQTRKLIRYAMKAVFAIDNATLLDAIKFVENENYRTEIITRLEGKREYEDIVKYWNSFDEMSSSQKKQHVKPFLNRTGNIEGDTILKTTLGQRPKEKLSYEKWVNEGYTVLIKIPERKLPEEVVRIISAFHVLNIWRACLARGDVFDDSSKQFTVICDEPQGWLGKNDKVLNNIFSKARAYRMNIICLIQSTEQISGESNRLLKIMLHNQPDIIALSETELFPGFDFDTLKKYQFIARVNGNKFIADSLKPITTKFKRSEAEVKEFIRRFRVRYNRHYQTVLKNIDRRLERWGSTEKKEKSQSVGGNSIADTDLQKKTNGSSNSSISTNF